MISTRQVALTGLDLDEVGDSYGMWAPVDLKFRDYTFSYRIVP